MEWWSDLWLNEGFATWAGTLAVDHVFPSWDTWTQFSQDDGSYALSTDALLSSHPIQVTINDPAEIDQIFDALSYSKGACMIRMLESMVGADVFRRGLRNYLETHQYKNTVTADLWASISQCAGYDVSEVMDTWCLHVGFPVIHCTGTATGELTLSQSRFVQVGSGDEHDQHLWKVPLSCLASADAAEKGSRGGDPNFKLTLASRSTTTAAPGGSWMKLNAGQTSFVRVNYDAEGWEALKAPISAQILPAVDRLGVANDVFALAATGLGSTATALNLALAFSENERDYSVWSAVASGTAQVSAIVEKAEYYPQFEAYCLKLYGPLFAHLGWEPQASDSHTTSMLRALCLAAVAKYGKCECASQAAGGFPPWSMFKTKIFRSPHLAD